MFDVSFSELLLILVVGLLVFGPEKLPEVIRTTGMWIAKIKRTFLTMRAEIEREMGVDEIKRDLHNHSIMQNLRDVRDDLQSAQHDLQSAKQELQNLPYDVSDVVQRANAGTTHSATPPIADSATPPAPEHNPAHAPLPDTTSNPHDRA